MGRFALSSLITRQTASDFPWGTLIVNLLGGLLIGGLMELGALKLNFNSPARYFLVTGVLGGFTTFSAFSLETMLMLTKGVYASVALYIGLSVVGTVLLAFAGAACVKAVF